MSCLKTARKWGVPRTTLIDLRAGRYSVHSSHGPMTALTKEEKNILCGWLVEMCCHDMLLSKTELLDTV
jgi:hypothetical protein